MADSCADLAAQIAALRAEIAKIKPVDENAIIQKSVKLSEANIVPKIDTAVAAGTALLANKLQPQIDSGIEKAREAFNKAFKADSAATNAEGNSLAAKRKADQAISDAVKA
ncbi:MAG: hypothetical protein RMX59_035130, partial [Nostoc sp. DedSLP05]